jgi:transposase
MSHDSRRRGLESAGLVHPRPAAVTSALFAEGGRFFLSVDKVQVKYEMLRAHVVDGETVTAAAAAHGYSRAEFYLVAAAFEEAGMIGLLDGQRGRKGPRKLTGEVRAALDRLGPCTATAAAVAVQAELGICLHPRTIQRARLR